MGAARERRGSGARRPRPSKKSWRSRRERRERYQRNMLLTDKLTYQPKNKLTNQLTNQLMDQLHRVTIRN